MSITDDLKGYADAAVETGRSVVNDGLNQSRTVVNERLTTLRETLDESIDEAAERAGKLAETATGAGTQVLDRARYDAYAAVGAVDAVVTGLVTRLQELPNDAVRTVARAQNGVTDAADRVQARFQNVLGRASETAGTAGKTVSDVRSGAIVDRTRETAEAYRKRVEQAYTETRSDLYARGTAVVTELRKDPRVQRVASLVGQATDTVEEVAAKPARRRSAEKAQATRARNERSARATKAASTRARKAAPAKAAKKTSARTSSARTSTARTSAATKSGS